MAVTDTWNPAPCEHLYAYCQMRWERQKCIAYNFLRCGYRQAARGIWHTENNLFEPFTGDCL